MNLNLACSIHWGLDGWYGLDLERCAKGVIADAKLILPFKDESVDAIFCSHFLEHLDYFTEVNSFLSECLRIMKAGAAIRITVPDIHLLALNIDDEEWYKSLAELDWKGSAFNTFMWLVSGWGHKWGYSETSLIGLLRDSGFVNVHRSAPFESYYPVFRQGGLDNRTGFTLFIEGEKSHGKKTYQHRHTNLQYQRPHFELCQVDSSKYPIS